MKSLRARYTSSRRRMPAHWVEYKSTYVRLDPANPVRHVGFQPKVIPEWWMTQVAGRIEHVGGACSFRCCLIMRG